MDIYPQDLGARRYLALLARRSGTTEPVPFRNLVGWLGRFWTRDEPLPVPAADALAAARGRLASAQIEAALAVLINTSVLAMLTRMSAVSSFFWPGPNFFNQDFAIFATGEWVALAAGVLAWWPRWAFRAVNRKPVRIEEISEPSGMAAPLEKSYAQLIAEMISQTVPANMEPKLRASLHALGEAIDHLPTPAPLLHPVEPLVREAQTARAEAQAETDPVVAASLNRQANALAQAAASAARASLQQRRVEALRAELDAQIKVLRLGLTAFTSGASDIADLTQLVETAQHVAREVLTVGSAEAELDAALSPSIVAPIPADVPAPLSLRAGQ